MKHTEILDKLTLTGESLTVSLSLFFSYFWAFALRKMIILLEIIEMRAHGDANGGQIGFSGRAWTQNSSTSISGVLRVSVAPSTAH